QLLQRGVARADVTDRQGGVERQQYEEGHQQQLDAMPQRHPSTPLQSTRPTRRGPPCARARPAAAPHAATVLANTAPTVNSTITPPRRARRPAGARWLHSPSSSFRTLQRALAH